MEHGESTLARECGLGLYVQWWLPPTVPRALIGFVHGLGGRRWTSWPDFPVVISQDRHEWRAAEQVRISVDQFAVGVPAVLHADAAQPMQAVDVVPGCQQQMHLVLEDCIQIGLALPIRRHGDPQYIRGIRLERSIAGGLVVRGNAVVVRHVSLGNRNFNVMQRDASRNGYGLRVILAQPKADDRIAGLGRLPAYDDLAGVAGLVGQPNQFD